MRLSGRRPGGPAWPPPRQLAAAPRPTAAAPRPPAASLAAPLTRLTSSAWGAQGWPNTRHTTGE